MAGWAGLPWAVLAVLLATFVRLAIDPWVEGVPFLTYFPTVLAASILMGWRWGAAVAAASAVVANFAFQAPTMAFALGPREVVATGGFLIAAAGMIWAADSLRRAMVELAEAARRETELNLELKHRVNNNLAVVQALADQTARLQKDPEAFRDAFTARLLALAEANRVLSGAGWEAAPMPELVHAALKPFLPSGQLALSGPACSLPLNACVPLTLVLHELATNATKHGALSRPVGRVQVDWGLEGSTFRLSWREAGGPEVQPPTRRGLGARLLKRQGGIDDLQVSYDPAGVACELVVKGGRPLEAPATT